MGRFSVEMEIRNHQDVNLAQAGHLPVEKVRRIKLKGLVDTGATSLVLPESVVAALGLPAKGRSEVRYADHRSALRQRVCDAEVELLGRTGVFSAIVEPERAEALIGAIVLEELDLVVDRLGQKLEPRDPREVTFAIG